MHHHHPNRRLLFFNLALSFLFVPVELVQVHEAFPSRRELLLVLVSLVAASAKEEQGRDGEASREPGSCHRRFFFSFFFLMGKAVFSFLVLSLPLSFYSNIQSSLVVYERDIQNKKANQGVEGAVADEKERKKKRNVSFADGRKHLDVVFFIFFVFFFPCLRLFFSSFCFCYIFFSFSFSFSRGVLQSTRPHLSGSPSPRRIAATPSLTRSFVGGAAAAAVAASPLTLLFPPLLLPSRTTKEEEEEGGIATVSSEEGQRYE